ncbi:PIN-like domain-containing protein [Nocardia altamirensis]|uniref:PIN-like domain-containing protein n=1 Tax=Nocardia altamirensis TaxID=472158 RepID=UPI0014355BFE|nr:PIN-like domain-containing protein [Nocardia altamirensis]
MKSRFDEWYRPSEGEIREFLTSATIALDANILLALYRVSDSQRKQILEVLEMVSHRIWVPYQAALEYQRNRLAVASTQQKVHETIAALADGGFDAVHAEYVRGVAELRSKAVKEVRDREVRTAIEWEFDNAIESLNKAQSKCVDNMRSALAKIRQKHTIDFEVVKASDPVRAALDEILIEDRVGNRPSDEEYEKRKVLANERIAAGRPPGYADVSKDDATGDCLIWFELLDVAKNSSTPMLYITDDVKDAYQKVRGQIVGPDVRLVREMRDFSGQDYHQTTLDGFLRLARKHLRATVSEDTIRTIESTHKVGETGLLAGKIKYYATANSSNGARLPIFVIDLLDEKLAPLGEMVAVSIPSREWLNNSGILDKDYVTLKRVPGNFGEGYQIVGPLVDRRTGEEKAVRYPENCNACGSRLILISREGREWLECTDEPCRERLIESLGP